MTNSRTFNIFLDDPIGDISVIFKSRGLTHNIIDNGETFMNDVDSHRHSSFPRSPDFPSSPKSLLSPDFHLFSDDILIMQVDVKDRNIYSEEYDYNKNKKIYWKKIFRLVIINKYSMVQLNGEISWKVYRVCIGSIFL